jgi:hypothetical protein
LPSRGVKGIIRKDKEDKQGDVPAPADEPEQSDSCGQKSNGIDKFKKCPNHFGGDRTLEKEKEIDQEQPTADDEQNSGAADGRISGMLLLEPSFLFPGDPAFLKKLFPGALRFFFG